MKNLIGLITRKEGHYNVVTCEKAPTHLQVMHLTDGQVAGAKVGDYIELQYVVAPSGAWWSTVRVLGASHVHD